MQYAVVVAVGDEEPTAVGLECVLHSHWHDEVDVRRRRMVARKRADVRDEGRTRQPVHSIYPDGLRMTGEEVSRKVGPDDAHEGICGRAPERDIHDPSKRKGRETPRQ